MFFTLGLIESQPLKTSAVSPLLASNTIVPFTSGHLSFITKRVTLGLNSVWGWQQDNLVYMTKELIEPK